MSKRPAVFHPAARKVIREFPLVVRKELGEAVGKLQVGELLSMPLSRPMPSFGVGVSELRIKDEAGEWRAFYIVKAVEAVYVFHAFSKKTRETPPREIALGQKRLKDWEGYRGQGKKGQ